MGAHYRGTQATFDTLTNTYTQTHTRTQVQTAVALHFAHNNIRIVFDFGNENQIDRHKLSPRTDRGTKHSWTVAICAGYLIRWKTGEERCRAESFALLLPPPPGALWIE
ncbi:unnamed protein product [Ceratitis capitata]|uniref:(Mediterranean fruit fly) hypothetical protein n=1 Tax=Ceratitis capitata TaxID=7213 RepID=A0A811VBY0_CERCA|nr:unnamed protein product [Ceratitis capitata]